MTVRHFISAASALLVSATLAWPVSADPLSAAASDNATVQPAGPRTGTSGKAFLNVEGSAAGSFASYGVADFGFGSLPYPVISVNSIELALTQSNAAFSAAGAVVFALDQSATLADIQPGTSPLAFDGADPGTTTDVSQGDLSLLNLGGGPFAYTVVANGAVDLYNFTLDAATEAALLGRLNAGNPIRIVVGTGDATLAGTWAGSTNSTYAGPTLNLDVTYDTSTPTQGTTWGAIKRLYR